FSQPLWRAGHRLFACCAAKYCKWSSSKTPVWLVESLRIFGGTYVQKTFISASALLSASAILTFASAARADELSDIQAQAKQLREQNQAMIRRLADLEKRQKALETTTAKPAVSHLNPGDAMAAD